MQPEYTKTNVILHNRGCSVSKNLYMATFMKRKWHIYG